MTDEPTLAELEHRYLPLKERVFGLVSDQTTFTVKDVKKLFPDKNDKAIYRVIKELENEKRIRYLAWDNGGKVYTCVGVSNLPTLIGADGSTFPCSEIIKNIDAFYDSNGIWSRLHSLNGLPVAIAKLFVIAEFEDRKQLKEGWIATQQELLAIKAQAQSVVGYCDSILKHPSMNGDLEKFKAVFAGDDEHVPDPPTITRFKVWYKKWSERLAS